MFLKFYGYVYFNWALGGFSYYSFYFQINIYVHVCNLFKLLSLG